MLKIKLNNLHFIITILLLSSLNGGVVKLFFGEFNSYISIFLMMLYFCTTLLIYKTINKKSLRITLPIFIFVLILTISYIINPNTLIVIYLYRVLQLLIIISIMFIYCVKDKSKTKSLLKFLIIDNIIIGVFSLINLIKTPLIARYLATGDSIYSSMVIGICGSYEYFYSLCLLVPILFYNFIELSKNRFVNFMIFLLSIYMIIKSQFTIAFILALASVLVSVVVQLKNKFIKALLIVIILICSLQYNIIIPNSINFVQSKINLSSNTNIRLNEIKNSIIGNRGSGDTNLSLRTELYKKSFDVFIDSPFIGSFGENIVGRHSSWLDLLGMYGLLSISLYIGLYLIYKHLQSYINYENVEIYRLCWLIYIVMGIVNTTLFATQNIMLLIFIPIILSDKNKKSLQ